MRKNNERLCKKEQLMNPVGRPVKRRRKESGETTGAASTSEVVGNKVRI